jgi:predicted DNA-binding transcriptional regulator AlpA
MTAYLPVVGSHYLFSERIYQVKRVSRATDEIELEDIATGKLYAVRYAVFQYAYKQVWKIGAVCQFLGRRPRSIYRYEENNLIQKPKRYEVRGGRSIRFYTKEDVLEMHECISSIHQGRPRKDRRVSNNDLPDKASLLRMFKERFENGKG